MGSIWATVFLWGQDFDQNYLTILFYCHFFTTSKRYEHFSPLILICQRHPVTIILTVLSFPLFPEAHKMAPSSQAPNFDSLPHSALPCQRLGEHPGRETGWEDVRAG